MLTCGDCFYIGQIGKQFKNDLKSTRAVNNIATTQSNYARHLVNNKYLKYNF